MTPQRILIGVIIVVLFSAVMPTVISNFVSATTVTGQDSFTGYSSILQIGPLVIVGTAVLGFGALFGGRALLGMGRKR